MNQQILDRLDALAAKLGVATDHLWHALLIQARIEGITDSIFLLFVIVAGYYTAKWGRWIATDDNSDFELWVPFAAVGLVLLLMFILCVGSIPAELFNPEYFALHRILELVK